MPLQKLQFRPGLNREGTDYSNEGGWYDGDKIRFRSGYPEKIGGWSRLSPAQFLGICRSLWCWIDLGGASYIGMGTSKKYYIEYGSTYYDITPYIYSSSPNLNGPFSVTDGSNVLTVVDAQYGPNVGDYVVFSGAVGLGGNVTAGVLNSEFVVATVGAGTYTVTLPVNASALDIGNGGSAVVANYQYPIGNDVATIGNGWGAGPWSRGSWGSGYTSGLVSQLRLWSNDNFGQDLIIAPRGGPIAIWQDVDTVSTRAALLSKVATSKGFAGQFVPVATNQVIASAIQRFVIAMGSNPYDPSDPDTDFDPMRVRWSDQENPYEWVPAATNQAGEFPLSSGSYIVAGRATRQEILIWTDSALYSMQYLGPPYAWGFNILMDNISVMSPNAMITVNNVTYWMGRDKFYVYTGRVETLPCALRQFVFEDINTVQSFQIFAGSNEAYNEVWWYYVSASSNATDVDRYIIYNYVDQVWYYGTLGRTAWIDSGIQPYPVAADYNRRLLYHESAVDDVSGTAPVPINAYIQSSDFDIGDGHNFGFVWRILPDVNFNGSNVNSPVVTMTVKPRQNSGTPYGSSDNVNVQSSDNFSTRGVYNVQQFDGQVYTRLRGRQMAFRIESTTLGVSWQLGTPRIDIRQDGRR